ncbi:DinB family protein [uncultured Croceitalea sp.]|uniref:DinB family protein n=1 Tax=uncultured Croceitalea sp. TaxID=1798908 RepID=UPI0033068725
MNQLFTITTQNHKILYRYLTTVSLEKLTKTPEGFNNNIWWNIAHVVVTQQLLVYGRSGLPLNISLELVNKYRKGTFPDGEPEAKEISLIKELLINLPEKTKSDYEAGIFTSYEPYMTSPKIPLNSVEDAIAFNVFHEGLHLGTVMALAKLI